jgi:tryptophanyl-tRNA synthetase
MRLPGTDGKAKMSKSLGNCIYLADPEEVVRDKIMSMYTDPDHIRVQDPGKLEGNTVFTYLDAFCQPEHFAEFLPDYQSLDELKAHYQRGGLGDVKVKKFLNNVMQSLLSPMRERRTQWEGRLPEVYEILKKGSEIAAETAQGTLDRVRHAMKIDYFTDNGLLK